MSPESVSAPAPPSAEVVPALSSVVVATGMQSEARLLHGTGLAVLVSGGRPAALAAQVGDIPADRFGGVLSFGLAGGLDPALAPGDLVVGTEVVLPDGRRVATDPGWTGRLAAALPAARRGPVVGSGHMVADRVEKSRLHGTAGALAVDMESQVAAALAARCGLPFAVLRAVADPADRALPPAATVGLGANGNPRILPVLLALLRSPGQLPDLIRIARDAAAADRALRRALAACATVLRQPR